jgi:hypothetical protein
MIGFNPLPSNRIAIRNDQGQKVGYLASVNGRQVLQSLDGRNQAYILKFKQIGVLGRTGACSGSFAPSNG